MESHFIGVHGPYTGVPDSVPLGDSGMPEACADDAPLEDAPDVRPGEPQTLDRVTGRGGKEEGRVGPALFLWPAESPVYSGPARLPSLFHLAFELLEVLLEEAGELLRLFVVGFASSQVSRGSRILRHAGDAPGTLSPNMGGGVSTPSSLPPIAARTISRVWEGLSALLAERPPLQPVFTM